MKIIVISDTHIPEQVSDLPKKLYDDLGNCDLILHAGDLVDLSVLDRLKKFADVKAVYGNMDYPEVRKVLPDKQVIKCGKFKIGLFHGYGPPDNLPQVVTKVFNEKLDIIIFGHSHSALNEYKDGVLLFNPGSPTDKTFSLYNSYGVLEINDKIKSKIIKL